MRGSGFIGVLRDQQAESIVQEPSTSPATQLGMTAFSLFLAIKFGAGIDYGRRLNGDPGRAASQTGDVVR